MQIPFTFTAIVIATSSLLAAQEWQTLDGIIPSLTPGTTTITRLDNFSTADIQVDASSLVVNNGPTAAAVKDILGSREAGWYTGTRTPSGNGGTIATVTGEGSTILASASGVNGGYTAVKFNELSAASLNNYDALKISFDTGTPSNTTRVGQPQNFGLFYSISGSSDVVQVGTTYSGVMSAVMEKSYSWELNAADYEDLFTQGGTFYLVLNTGILDNSYAFNTLPVSNFAIAGQYSPSVPEPSSTTMALAGLGALLFRRKRQVR